MKIFQKVSGATYLKHPVITTYCVLCRRLRLLAFVNIANDSCVDDLLFHGHVNYIISINTNNN